MTQESRVFGLWYGGSSYAMSEVKDLETWANVELAKDALVDRYGKGGFWKQEFLYMYKEPEFTFTPGVDEETEIHLYYSPINGGSDMYPDAVIKLSFTEDDEAFAYVEDV